MTSNRIIFTTSPVPFLEETGLFNVQKELQWRIQFGADASIAAKAAAICTISVMWPWWNAKRSIDLTTNSFALPGLKACPMDPFLRAAVLGSDESKMLSMELDLRGAHSPVEGGDKQLCRKSVTVPTFTPQTQSPHPLYSCNTRYVLFHLHLPQS